MKRTFKDGRSSFSTVELAGPEEEDDENDDLSQNEYHF